MLDFRMQTFLEVCRCMNFTKAAKQLNITQPAVSQHIHYIENFYHTRLFYFQGKKLMLTQAGEVLYQAITTMQHDELCLRDTLVHLDAPTGHLNFGVTLTIGEYIMPQHLSRYLKQYPDTTVRMIVSNTHDLLMRLTEGEIDFALIEGYFTKTEYDSLIYSRESYIPVCSADYTFSEPPVCLEDLLKETVLTREPGSGSREILEKCLAEKNLTFSDFRHCTEIGNLFTLKSLVAEGLGITFLYETAVRQELLSGKFREIHLADFHCTHDFTYIWRKNSIFSDRYQRLFETLLDGGRM